MPLMTFLKEFRAKHNMNQTELAQKAGVSRQTISQIERGNYAPSVTLALKLAHIFNASVEDLFEIKEDNNEKN